jgi:hypothetical protein
MAKGKNTSPKLLITHYMKLDIYNNGCKNIPNNIMGNHAFPHCGNTTKGVSPSNLYIGCISIGPSHELLDGGGPT